MPYLALSCLALSFISFINAIMQVVRSDNGAFVIMDGYEGYNRATMDDMRIFGICVGGQNSRIQSVERMTVRPCQQCLSSFMYLFFPVIIIMLLIYL